jgi:putative endonuclease
MTNCIYIITNLHHTTLYIGVTNDLEKRLWEHKTKVYKGFSSRYNLEKLVYFEPYEDINDAIAREKYLKGKTRAFKEALINEVNPSWNDLSQHRHVEQSETSPQPFERHSERSEESPLSV